MFIRVTWGVAAADWAAFVARCPNATFFHTPAWYAANGGLGYVPATAHLRFADRAEAMLPMATRACYRGVWREAFAGIENGYGGLVSPEPLSPQHVEAAYRAVRQRFGDLRVVGNPFEAYANLPMGGERHQDATQVLPVLAPEAQRALMNDTRIKHCKRAAKAGFELEVRTRLTAEDARAFYPLYAERAGEWGYGKWARSEPYFRALCREAGGQLALFLARKDGQLAGFRLLGLHGPVVMDLYLATAKDAEALHVGPLLVTEALAWCHAQGYQTFDFQPSGRLEGVRTYKASFGATELQHVHGVWRSAAGRSLATLRRLAKRESA